MSNENEVYIIEDIHPSDAHAWRLNDLKGKKVTNIKFDDREWVEGWKGTSQATIEGEGAGWVFFAVKVRKVEKKSFWQKLFTWSW